ncbi:MAG: prepilin-type N-terminal cleavage/methylation domain-containing protein [Candidatus Zixiibacteriota bacterium]
MKILKSNKGVTLIEILLAVLLTGVISAAMFRVYINQHHAWNIQDSVIEMQQNARASIDELTRQIRMAGYALPNGLKAFEASNTDPDTIMIHYRTSTCDAPITHPMPSPSAELRCDGNDVSCFEEGQLVYIYDPNTETGEFLTITKVQTAASHIQHNTTILSKAYPAGSHLYSIEKVKYYIDYGDKLHPRLMVRYGNSVPQIYAEDITDMQFTYTLKNGITLDSPTIVNDVRRISIAVTARTERPDVEFEQEPYRFETYQSQVYLRNLGT